MTMRTDVAVSTMPLRRGDRPRTSGPMPHIQLDQLGSPKLQAALMARVFALPDVEERQTLVSDPRARAMWLRERVPIGTPDAFLAGREFGHFHLWDRSMHVVLPPDLALAAVQAGWAEVHPAAQIIGIPKNRVMLYGPRDDDELELVFHLLIASYRYAGGRMDGAPDR